jgi:ribose transport system substrate-binding protein
MGPDFTADGRMIGSWMAGKLGKDGKVAVVEGNPADTAGVNLVTGFGEGLKSGGIANVVASASTDWDRQRAFAVMSDMLTAHPDIQGAYGAIDEIALGALQAIKASGRKKDILLAGHNATCEGLAALLRKDLDYDIMTFPKDIGRTAVDLILKLKAGQEIPSVSKAQAYGIDTATAQAVLSGDTTGIPAELVPDVKARVIAASQGCK